MRNASSQYGLTVTTTLLAAWGLLAISDQAIAQAQQPVKVAVGDVVLHYVERGKGEPVILLHGGQGDYRAWSLLMDVLAPRYRVISYSRRYHWPNANPLTARNHSALIDADDLAGFLTALDLGAAHLVGTSYGAFTALALAIEHPEMVRSMVLAEPPVHRWIKETAQGAALYLERVASVYEPAGKAFAAGQDEAAMQLFIDSFDGPGTFHRLPAERREFIMQNALFFRAITSSSDPFPDLSKDSVRRLRMPVLIVRGADTDELHGLVTEELGRLLPGAQRVTIPQAGHGSPRQNPRAFNQSVLDFLEGQPRGYLPVSVTPSEAVPAPPESAEAKRIQGMVDRAAALVERRGKAAFAEFRKPDSEWWFGQTYLFAYDQDLNVLLNPAFPKREGTNPRGEKDVNGKAMHDEFLRVVREHGAGWVDYMFPKPGQTRPSQKWSYVRLVNVDGTPGIIGAGFYPEQDP